MMSISNRQFSGTHVVGLLTVVLLGVCVMTSAFDGVSFIFQSGDTARASDVNANFSELIDGLTGLEEQVETLQGLVDVLGAGVSELELTDLGGEGAENLGLGVNEGELKIVQADGSSFTKTAFGRVRIQSTTDGEVISLRITEDTHSFLDATNGTSSDIRGEAFGVTAGVAWEEDRPFYLYAVNADDTDSGLAFALSPDPTLTSSPSPDFIGSGDGPMGIPSDSGMFFLTSEDVTETHDNSPCLRIGGIRMQILGGDAGDTDWTLQSLDSSRGDGIRTHPFVGRQFRMVTGQNGADSGSFLGLAAITRCESEDKVPTWATPDDIIYEYQVHLDGQVTVFFTTATAGFVTNGVGGGGLFGCGLKFHLPYEQSIGDLQIYQRVIGRYSANGANDTLGLLYGQVFSDGFRLREDTAYLHPDDFTLFLNNLTVDVTYDAFTRRE